MRDLTTEEKIHQEKYERKDVHAMFFLANVPYGLILTSPHIFVYLFS